MDSKKTNSKISNVGWICPKCGKGLAPTVKSCDCNSIKNTKPVFVKN